MRCLYRALAFALVGPTAAAAEPDLAGVTVAVRRAGDAVQVQLSTTVDAPIAEVERVLMEVQYWPDWIPHLRKAHALQSDRHHIVLETEIDLPWPVSDVKETVNIERRRIKRGVELDWRHVRGDLKRNEGRWVLLRADRDHTFVRYEAIVQLDTWVPMFMLKDAEQKEAPWVIEGLRKRARFYAQPVAHR